MVRIGLRICVGENANIVIVIIVRFVLEKTLVQLLLQFELETLVYKLEMLLETLVYELELVLDTLVQLVLPAL